MTSWSITAKASGVEFSTELRLGWEVLGDPVSDDYTPDEISAAELWSIWRRQYKDERLEIFWLVHGDGIAEFAPFIGQGVGGEDFLSFFSWPVDSEGTRLRWTDLPVEDKLWNPERADKGGFIQEYTGWKPSAFQREMDVALIERIVGRGVTA
jgi:hypothetical protein